MPLEAQAASAGVGLLNDKAQACLYCSSPLPYAGLTLGILFPTFHMLLAVQCWGVANGRILSATQSCFLPAVCKSSFSWDHGLMPFTKNDFHQGCGMGLCSGGCWTEGQEGEKEIWL